MNQPADAGPVDTGPVKAAPDGRPDFEIGLALAGAISAGAYTAGVIDFLVQALQDWETARAGGAPTHRVRIRTIAGASAGAVTGALGIVALRHGLRPVELTEPERRAVDATPGEPTQRIRCVLPTLYRTWVERPRMVAAPGTGAMDLLGTDDLDPKKGPVRSLLNAALLDEIEAAAFDGPGPPPAADPGKPHLDPSPGPFPFLAATMHVFVTVTNLRGIPFEIGFGASTYGMLTHGDRLHYRIDNVGAAIAGGPWPEPVFLKQDKFLPLDGATLPEAAGRAPQSGWMSYGLSAVASAAFPGGLAPRLIETPFGQYVGRQYPLPMEDRNIRAAFPSSCEPEQPFKFLSVDGGVVNNTPFDYVEYALWEDREPRRTGADADRAVIMVAPFPEPPTFLGEGMPVDELGSVLKALLPTLMNQARFRSSELGRALKPDDKSRFLISPRRSLKDGPQERYPIACGLLSGFGGFLDEAFRAHDFQLGRRNCQSFLASSFSLPPPTKPGPSASKDPAHPETTEASALRSGEAELQAPVVPRPYNKEVVAKEVMVIPLVGEAQREVGLPPWPRMSAADFRTLTERIGGRFDAIKGPLIEAQVRKPEIRWVAGMLAWVSRPRLLNVIALTILADLVRRNQIAGWDFPPAVDALVDPLTVGRQADDVRLILASLVGSSRDTALGADALAGALHLDRDFVGAVLEGFGTLPETCPNRVVKAGGLYRLQMHVPAGMRAWPVIGGAIERLRPQAYRYG